MEYGSQSIDVGARCSLLRSFIVFWRGVAICTGNFCIFGVAWLKMASDTEINQIDLSCRGEHHIRWFQISKNDGWSTCVKVVENSCQLNSNSQHFGYGKKMWT